MRNLIVKYDLLICRQIKNVFDKKRVKSLVKAYFYTVQIFPTHLGIIDPEGKRKNTLK